MHIIVHDTAAVWRGDQMALAFAECFQSFGFLVSIHTSSCGHQLLPQNSTEEDNYFIVDFTGFFLFNMRKLNVRWKRAKMGKVIFYNVTRFHDWEPSTQCWLRHWNQIRKTHYDGRVDWIFDYDSRNCTAEWQRRSPVKRVVCPPGYHSIFEQRKLEPAKHDVSFLGWVHDGTLRDKVLKPLEERFNVCVCTRCHVPRKQRFKNPMRFISYDRNIDALSTKILLNLQSDSNNSAIAFPRIVQIGMANRICVLSNPLDYAPWQDVQDSWVVCPREDMADKVAWLLDHASYRKRVADTGYHWAKNNWSQREHLHKALQEVGML